MEAVFTGRVDDDPAFENELEAARIMLEQQGRRVLVVGAFLDKNGEGGLARSVSNGFTRAEARVLAQCLRHEAKRLDRLANTR